MSRYIPLAAHTDWQTPAEVWQPLDEEFGFTLDVAAAPDNAKCPRFYAADSDALARAWAPEICWMNPPYGYGLPVWIQKAHAEAQAGATVVALLPARTDTAWFHDHVLGHAEIRFIRSRVYFERPDGTKGRAPFPSMIVIWRPSCDGRRAR